MSIDKGRVLSEIEIIPITEDVFFKMEGTWQECLAQSGANPLFLSWIWVSSWWGVWKTRLNLVLLLLGVYEDKKLIGIVPCYTYNHTGVLGINKIRCEFIGDYTASNDSIRSEYFDFILPKARYKEIIPKIFEYFILNSVDEVILKDLDSTSDTSNHLLNKYPNSLIFKEKGIKIASKQSFEDYLQQLGKNTRLKLYNRRKLMENSNLSFVDKVIDIEHFFETLNTMHLSRWGKVCFSVHSLSFHFKVAHYFMERGQLQCLKLVNENTIQAVCYDIEIKGVMYNIQLGFYDQKNTKISMGTLMLGFAIEQAHLSDTTLHYDLLAGNGKNTFYKKKLNGIQTSFVTYQIPLTLKAKIFFSLKRIKQYLKYLLGLNNK
ncbi:MAG: hypothetical protein ACI9YH_002811 [Colwellia sp.]|jgi:hypothetical protein